MAKKGMRAWSSGDWLWFAASELALFAFLFVLLRSLGAEEHALFPYCNVVILWALLNFSFFACPVVRKHFF